MVAVPVLVAGCRYNFCRILHQQREHTTRDLNPSAAGDSRRRRLQTSQPARFGCVLRETPEVHVKSYVGHRRSPELLSGILVLYICGHFAQHVCGVDVRICKLPVEVFIQGLGLRLVRCSTSLEEFVLRNEEDRLLDLSGLCPLGFEPSAA